MKKYKPIRLFVCPKCGRKIIHRTRKISMTSICVDDGKYTDIKMVAVSHETNTLKSLVLKDVRV